MLKLLPVTYFTYIDNPYRLKVPEKGVPSSATSWNAFTMKLGIVYPPVPPPVVIAGPTSFTNVVPKPEAVTKSTPDVKLSNTENNDATFGTPAPASKPVRGI